MNVVTGAEGRASAVLLRGGRPLLGEEQMRLRRGRVDHLVDGPGKLSQALAVIGEHNHSSVFDGPVRLLEGPLVEGAVVTGPRVGITRAVERPWRFRLALPRGLAVRG